MDDYTPRTGYSGKLLAGNKGFYDLLGEKTLRQLNLAAFDYDWTLATVVAAVGHTSYQQGYVYDFYDRGLGAPPLPSVGSSKLFEAGYWPTAYARAVFQAIFDDAGVGWRGELLAVFDTALLPATAPFGYSDQTRASQALVAGYGPTAQVQRFTDERDEVLPVDWTLPTKRDTSLVQGSEAQLDALTFTRTITVVGYYDLKAEQDVALYCNTLLAGEVSATLQLFVNGQAVGNYDDIRGNGNQDTTLTALAERQLLQVGDVVQARYKFDKWPGGTGNNIGPFDESFKLLPAGRLTVQLLADFAPGDRVHLADWLPDMLQKDFVKGFIQAYGLTQTTDPYTGAVLFRRTARVAASPRTTAVDWSARRDGSQPAKRSWRLGELAQRNWFRWKEDESNTSYAQAARTQAGRYWDADAAKKAAQDFAAAYLDNGAADASLDASKDVLTLPFAASPLGAEGLLLLPY